MNNDFNKMLFPDMDQDGFDFQSMIGSKSYRTITGIPVKIDRIYHDITGTTVMAISGTFCIRGVKVRGVWDHTGHIMEFKRTLQLFVSFKFDWNSLFHNTTEDMFQLVYCQE